MRLVWTMVLVWVMGLAGGCATPAPAPTTSWLHKLSAATLAQTGDMVQMDVALIERPVGDPYINHGLWDATDEQVVPLEQKARLEGNGFRVGQIIGSTPEALQTLLTSERSCANPRRRLIQAGYQAPQLLGPPLPQCHYEVNEDGRPVPVTLGNAQFILDVVPGLTGQGSTRLRFTPRVEYGEAMPNFRPAADQSGWTMQLERPSKDYPQLAWEVVLNPNAYLVIGARADKPKTLGYQAFMPGEESNEGQRLLVIRTAPLPSNRSAAAEPTLEDLARASVSPPLALQAAMTAVRANGP